MNGLITSFLVSGLLLLAILNYTLTANENSISHTLNTITQIKQADVVEIIEADFRKIGYVEGGYVNGRAIVTADTHMISYETDLNRDGTNNLIEWEYDTSAPKNVSENPNDYSLTRTQHELSLAGVLSGTETTDMSYGITEFRFIYYDESNNKLSTPVANPENITAIEIEMVLESNAEMNNGYERTYFQKRLEPVNLNLN